MSPRSEITPCGFSHQWKMFSSSHIPFPIPPDHFENMCRTPRTCSHYYAGAVTPQLCLLPGLLGLSLLQQFFWAPPYEMCSGSSSTLCAAGGAEDLATGSFSMCYYCPGPVPPKGMVMNYSAPPLCTPCPTCSFYSSTL